MKLLFVAFICFIGFLYGGNFFVDNNLVWPATFLLGALGVFILYLSSQQMSKAKKIHQDIVKKQEEIEDKQSFLMLNVSEEILKYTKETVDRLNIISKNKTNLGDIDEIFNDTIKLEKSLLDITNDLIEFLRLKSKKVDILNESFDINNVLNDVIGSITNNFKNSNTKLILDIENDVPRKFIGDSLKISQILLNLIERSMIMSPNDDVKLSISIFKKPVKNQIDLEFKINDSGYGLNEDELKNYFVPNYNERNGKLENIGLFVAKQMTKILGGDLDIQSKKGKGTLVALSIPLEMAESSESNYNLPSKYIGNKKVLVVDDSYDSSLAIKNLFNYFKYDARVDTVKSFLNNKPDMYAYDIILLNEEIFDENIAKLITSIRSSKELKVISLKSMFEDQTKDFLYQNNIIDRRLTTPLTQRMVFDLIVDLFDLNIKNENKVLSAAKNIAKIPIFRGTIYNKENISIDNFLEFKDINILAVEDNIINQKLLTAILSSPGINVDIANNGLECLDKVLTQKIQYDLILMDISMPIMDGYEASINIRNDETLNTLPIVSLTALVLDTEIEKMYQSGINAFLAKPLKLGQLYTVFEMFLGHKKTNVVDTKTKKEKITQLPGLDIEDGIKKTNNSEILYNEVLKEFLDAYGNSAETFEILVDEQRYEQLKMLLLDLKGLTSSIGANSMFKLSDEVFKLIIFNKRHLLPGYVKAYKEKLDELSYSINQYTMKK
ncbi:MAG: response regulator [Sulfurovaceae bacterium]|nr:response regulator [Sulfurovaceae bacterium]MDD5548751.1 response regulator [Sulfurovaceae bacterium]